MLLLVEAIDLDDHPVGFVWQIVTPVTPLLEKSADAVYVQALGAIGVDR